MFSGHHTARSGARISLPKRSSGSNTIHQPLNRHNRWQKRDQVLHPTAKPPTLAAWLVLAVYRVCLRALRRPNGQGHQAHHDWWRIADRNSVQSNGDWQANSWQGSGVSGLRFTVIPFCMQYLTQFTRQWGNWLNERCQWQLDCPIIERTSIISVLPLIH